MLEYVVKKEEDRMDEGGIERTKKKQEHKRVKLRRGKRGEKTRDGTGRRG